MKALIVKEDGLIYAAEVPEEPELCKLAGQDQCEDRSEFRGLRWVCKCRAKEIDYEAVIASAKESAVLVSDQEKAARLISQTMGKEAGFGALLLPVGARPRPGIYPIPVQWEVREEFIDDTGRWIDRQEWQEQIEIPVKFHESRLRQVAILKESTKQETDPDKMFNEWIGEPQPETQDDLWAEVLKTMGFFPAPKYLIEVKEQFTITRKP